jgi:hypothetical protein
MTVQVPTTRKITNRFRYLSIEATLQREMRRRHLTLDGLDPATAAELVVLSSNTWGLHSLGYSPNKNVPDVLWTQNWSLTDKKIYLNINNAEQKYRNGRITIIVRDATHRHDWTHVDTAETVYDAEHRVFYTPGVAVWSAAFHDKASFLDALRVADQLMHKPDELHLTAGLIPAKQSPAVNE